jgi:hypothetical protein
LFHFKLDLSAPESPKKKTMNELITLGRAAIDGQTVHTVNARELHAFLEGGTRFRDWIKRRIADYGFVGSRGRYTAAPGKP